MGLLVNPVGRLGIIVCIVAGSSSTAVPINFTNYQTLGTSPRMDRRD